jgi:beta-1,4-mannooligosaccharide/beta-1,4-mannosyl-N-acetylglucosamine phosphorylase
MPWQDRPAGCEDVIWRYDKNPLIDRTAVKCANSIFNSAVVPFEGGFAGVFRVDDRARNMNLHAGFSKDGLTWEISQNPIAFEKAYPDLQDFQYGYDPRVTFFPEDSCYYVTWCNAYGYKPTIGIAKTVDFKTFTMTENAFLPFNRNGVLFPRKFDNEYLMLSRPSDSGHTPFGDIYISRSKDLLYWGRHRHVMSPRGGWESTKIGAGPVPIETDKGWLMFYHGVLTSCNGFVYSFSAALLDRDEPWRVLKRGREYLIAPHEIYETTGDVPNVTFPCTSLVDGATGRIAIYYGCADTVTGLAFGYVDDIVQWIKENKL